MILPIYAYGHPVLRTKAKEISLTKEEILPLIEDMFETMNNASGVGLAAPQIGQSIRLFVVDTQQIDEKGEGIKKVFINARMLEETGEPWDYEEGCLSIPDVNGDVTRPPVIRIRYMDEQLKAREDTFTGMNARVIQHEYDHIEGILFTDKLKPLRKKRIQKKLEKIRRGRINLKYPMVFVRF